MRALGERPGLAMSRASAEIFPKKSPSLRPSADTLMIGNTIVDLASGTVVGPDGRRAALRPKPAAVLTVLAARPGHIVSKAELLDTVWASRFVDEDALVQCIGDIRRALGADGAALKTYAKRGYSLDTAPPVRHHPMSRWSMALAFATLMLIGGLWTATSFRDENPSPDAGPAIAVLPFSALSEGERWQRLAQALTLDVISDLARNDWIFVYADAASRSLADAGLDAARDMGADYLLTGSVQTEAGRARLSVALIGTQSGQHMWGEQFTGSVADLLDLQRDASEAVIGQLAARWSGPIARHERAAAVGRGAANLTAYDLYLQAAERIQVYGLSDMEEAERLLKRAVALDPGFGEAWAKLSLLSYSRVHPEMTEAEMEALWAQGDAAALEAIRVSPDVPTALVQAANVVRWTDPDRAEQMVRRAATLAPNDADLLAYMAFRALHFPALGEEAMGWIERAITLNPTRPDWYDWNRGAVMVLNGYYDEAVSSYRRAPDHIEARAGLVAALALAGHEDEAREKMAALMAQTPHFTPQWFADAAGLHPDAARIFTQGFEIAAQAP